MSRFRIRQRIKDRLLGRTAAQAAGEPERIELTLVMPDDHEIVVLTEPHYTLVMASQTIDTPIHAHCPDGHCGACHVTVLEGADALRPAAEAELALLDEKFGADRDPRVRLACHARLVRGGAKVKVEKVWSLEEAMNGAGAKE